jgi:glycosyltransferase involved in cell wall biosynthesis
VLIVVQNLSVPFDRRVWLECQTLVRAGYGVSVICPRTGSESKFEELDGVRIYRYRPAPAAQAKLAFVYEFAHGFVAVLWLIVRVMRRDGFAAVQACNPPDTLWPIGGLLKRIGVKFVFDHHDLCPELYRTRFPDGPQVIHSALLYLERRTFATADQVVTTNESYRAVALGRGRRRPDEVTVVRTGPDPAVMRRVDDLPEHRRGREHLAVYIGVMGPQDGVDYAVRAAAHLKHGLGRNDIAFTFMGAGDCLETLKRLAVDLEVTDLVLFTGRAPDELVKELMSSATLGLCPDPKNPLNDLSTMNKTMEYMAFELPVVAFDLVETRESAGPAAMYVEPNDVERYGQAIADLVDDPDRRRQMARAGRARVVDVLAWEHQAPSYVAAYERLLGPV